MTPQRISKRTVETLHPTGRDFTVWDDTVTGFGVCVRTLSAKSYAIVYRAGAGRGAPGRRFTIAAVGKVSPPRQESHAASRC
jgi:hypothetical protein